MSCIVYQPIETLEFLEKEHHARYVIFWINGNKESVVKSIINGNGQSVNSSNRKATL